MSDITKLSIHELSTSLTKKNFTSKELVQAYIKKAEEFKHLNAYIGVFPEVALKQAEISDKMLQSGKARGPLEGIPIAIKDLFCTDDMTTTAASKMLHNFNPTYESTVTQKLRDAGAVRFGKTNLDAFGMGSTNTNSHFGASINPWRSKVNPDNELVPGGSSGGSAVAVAARLAAAALGTDTGGSIRQPAAFCGVVGVKPTYGRCSRYGMIAFASSLDQAGVFAQNVKDSAIILETICGHDEKDSTCALLKPPRIIPSIDKGVNGLRVGIPKEYKTDGLSEEIHEVWKLAEQYLKDAGAQIVQVSLPHTPHAVPTYYMVASAEASSNLERYDGIKYGYKTESKFDSLREMIAKTRSEGFGTEVKRRIMLGTRVLSAESYGAFYIKAQKVRRLIAQDFVDAFENVDVILVPTTPTPAFSMKDRDTNPITMYLNDIFTVPASLAGLPAMSIPIKLSNKEGLPLGMQLIGNYYKEQTLFQFGAVLEKAAGFNG